jgi:hypothetical protein
MRFSIVCLYILSTLLIPKILYAQDSPYLPLPVFDEGEPAKKQKVLSEDTYEDLFHKMRYIKMQNDFLLYRLGQLENKAKVEAEKNEERHKDKVDFIFGGGVQFSKDIEQMKGLFLAIDDLEDNYLYTIGYITPDTEIVDDDKLPEEISLISYREAHLQFSANFMLLRINNFNSVPYDFCKLGADLGIGFFYDWSVALLNKNYAFSILNVDIALPSPSLNWVDGGGIQLISTFTVSHAVGFAACRTTFLWTACYVGGGGRF